MPIETALGNILLDDADVSVQIGTRYTREPLSQEATLPALTYKRVSSGRHHDLNFGFPIFQVTAWGATGRSARAVAQVVIEALQRYKGVKDGMTITQVSVKNDLDLYDPESKRHTVPIDIQLNYWEE